MLAIFGKDFCKARIMIMINQSPVEKNFVQNPYAFYRHILKRGGVCFWKNYNQKAFFNFETINKIFKDKRFGRELPLDFKQPNEKNLSDFYRIERNSMLELEGKKHTRLRGLVLRAFTLAQKYSETKNETFRIRPQINYASADNRFVVKSRCRSDRERAWTTGFSGSLQ